MKNKLQAFFQYRFRGSLIGWLVLRISILLCAILLFILLQNEYLLITSATSHLVFLVTIAFLGSVSLFEIVFFFCFDCKVFLQLDQSMSSIEKSLLDLTFEKITIGNQLHLRLVQLLTYLHALIDREERSQFLLKQAELDALQQQINPHFLYNTLDSIRGLALKEGSSNTADMIESLSKLFRYTIDQTQKFLPLGLEIKYIEDYIKIQQYRFSARFDVIQYIDFDDENLLNSRVPKLILQPIIENAIYHGLDSLVRKGEIRIRIFSTQSRLIISIRDNGIGMDEYQLKHLNETFVHCENYDEPAFSRRGSGVALQNVNKRIKLYYGERFGLVAFSTKNIGTEIQITLPLHNEKSFGAEN